MYANKIVGVVFIIIGILTAYYYGQMYYDLKFVRKGLLSERIEYQVLFLIVSGFILIFLGTVLIFKKSKRHTSIEILDDELNEN